MSRQWITTTAVLLAYHAAYAQTDAVVPALQPSNALSITTDDKRSDASTHPQQNSLLGPAQEPAQEPADMPWQNLERSSFVWSCIAINGNVCPPSLHLASYSTGLRLA